VTDVNGITTSYEYDAFGRRVKETRPDATATPTQWSYRQFSTCGGSACPGNVSAYGREAVIIRHLAPGGAQLKPPAVSYRDRLGRELLAQCRRRRFYITAAAA